MVFSIILIIFLIFIVKLFKIDILSPAGIYTTMWFFFICGSVLFLGKEYKFTFYGINWILISCYIWIIIEILFRHINKLNTKISFPKSSISISWNLLVFFIVLGICSVIYSMLTSGISFNVFSNFSSLQNTAHDAAVNRYSGAETSSLVGQILGSFVYISPICAGYSFVYVKNKKEKAICFSSILPAVFSMLLTSAKLALIAFVILFFIGFYISYIFYYKHIPTVKKKTFITTLIFAIVLYTLFYLSFVLRIGSGESNLSKVVIEKLMIYAFGHVQGFDVWFYENSFKIYDYGFGKNTFLAISSKLGLAEKKQGIYGFIPGTCTNVYTQFRSLIEDFGPILSIIILISIAFIIYFILKKVTLEKKPSVLSQTILAALLFWNLYFIVSPWVYTTYIITFIVFGIFLYVSFNFKFVWRKRN